MTDTEMTPFELGLARRLVAYSEIDVPAIDSVGLAADAMATPSGMGLRDAWQALRAPVRLALVAGVAIALLAGSLYVGSRLLPPAPHLSSLVPTAAPTSGPTAQSGPPLTIPASPAPPPGGTWTAVYARRSVLDGSIQIITLPPTGTSRVVRSIATTGQGAISVTTAGSLSRTGAAFLYTEGFESSATTQLAVFDLGRPADQPTLFSMGAPLGPRWSTTGLLAIPGYNPANCTSEGPECWAVITILNPRTGALRSLGEIRLFGGGPSIVWAEDGSGIWDGGQLKPVDGGPDIPIGPNLLFVDRHVGVGGMVMSADRAVYAWDGQNRLSVTESVVGGRHTAAVNRIGGNGTASVLAQWDLPDGAYDAAIGEPDPSDSQFPTTYTTGPINAPVGNDGPVVRLDGTLAQTPGGTFLGWVPSSLAASWPEMP
jgi:hypothetical protein